MKITLFLIIITACVAVSTGCGGPAQNTNIVINGGNANAVNTANAADPLAPTKKAETATENNAPTISPVVTAYYSALKKKDDAELKNVLSKSYIAAIQEDMKADGKSGSMAAYLAESEPVSDALPEARNEKIAGDKGTAEVRGGSLKVWTPFEFVNEGGKWKYTGKSPDLMSVPKTSN